MYEENIISNQLTCMPVGRYIPTSGFIVSCKWYLNGELNKINQYILELLDTQKD